jgi:hypothetical protein
MKGLESGGESFQIPQYFPVLWDQCKTAYVVVKKKKKERKKERFFVGSYILTVTNLLELFLDWSRGASSNNTPSLSRPCRSSEQAWE